MMDEALQYLNERKVSHPNFSFEIIIVDDGSIDNTYKVRRETNVPPLGRSFVLGEMLV